MTWPVMEKVRMTRIAGEDQDRPRRGRLLAGGFAVALAGLMLAALMLAGPVQAQAAPRRVALVLGNSHYRTTPLVNPVNDAELVAGTLGRLGFEVEKHLDLSNAGMLEVVKRWLQGASQAGVRVVYYSGHGAVYRGQNFLLPVDVALQSEDDLPAAAFNLDTLTARLARFESGLNVVVLDACRSVPTNLIQPGVRYKGGHEGEWTPGFAPMSPPRGMLIAYSTSPGAMAADNPQLRNSVYTRNLVDQMLVPGQPVELVFRRTREAVMQASRGTQVPREDNGLVGNDFCFLLNAAGRCGR